MPKTCLFCGGGPPFNEEHVWARWLWDYLFEPGEAALIVKGFRDSQGEHPVGDKPFNKDLNVITRAVCERCNGGWMKRLEDQMKDMLTRPPPHEKQTMLWGQEVELFKKGRNLLARWAVKTAITRDSVDPPTRRTIHPTIAQELCRLHGRPPSPILVFLGWFVPNSDLRIAHWGRTLSPIVRSGMDLAPRGFSSTFSVGQMLFQVVRLNEEADRPATMRTADELSLPCIWPNSKHSVLWPPSVYHTDDTLKRFATGRTWF